MCFKPIKNILCVIHSPGSDHEMNFALVPADKLEGINLSDLDGKMVNNNAEGEIADTIVDLYQRFGLESYKAMSEDEIAKYKEIHPNWKPVRQVPVDLDKYLDITPPFFVDEVVHFGWVM